MTGLGPCDVLPLPWTGASPLPRLTSATAGSRPRRSPLPMALGPSSLSRRISLVSLMTSDMGTVWLRWTRTDVDSSGRPLGPARRPFS